jgi:hypothetical protein
MTKSWHLWLLWHAPSAEKAASAANLKPFTRASSRHCGAVRVALIDDKAPVAISLAFRDYLLPVLVDI